MRFARLALLPLFAAACSRYDVRLGDPPAEALTAPRAGLSRVCLARQAGVGALLTAPVRDNGLTVGATEGPSWFCWSAGPGFHTLTVEVSDAPPLELTLNGEERLIEHVIAVGEDRLVDHGAVKNAPPAAEALAGVGRYATLDGMVEGASAPARVVPGLAR